MTTPPQKRPETRDLAGHPCWRSRLAYAASGLALLGACQTGPTPAQIQASDWAQAARTDTPIAYAIYMRTHPDGQHRDTAQARIEELKALDEQAFAAAREKDTEQSYSDYLASHPWGAHAREADGRRMALAAPRLASEETVDWAEAQTVDRIEHYEVFLDNWPRGVHAEAARKRLAELWKTDQGEFVKAKRSGSPAELSAFMRRYKDSPFVEDARRELELIGRRDEEAWRRAFAANSITAFDAYLIAQPYGRWRVEAQQAIDQLRERDYQAWRQAAALDEIWAYEDYRLRYPWGSWYDTAFYRIDWIRGGRFYSAWDPRWDYAWDRGWRWGHSGRDGHRDDGPNTYPPLFSGQKRPAPRPDDDPRTGLATSPPPGGTLPPAQPGLWSDDGDGGRGDRPDRDGRRDDDGTNVNPPLFGGQRRPAPQSDDYPQNRLPPPPGRSGGLSPQPGLWSDRPGANRSPDGGTPPASGPPPSWTQPSPPPLQMPEPQPPAPASRPLPSTEPPPRTRVDELRQDEF